MEIKNQVFDRYKEEYFEARKDKDGGREKQTKILDTVCNDSARTILAEHSSAVV